MFSIKRLEPSRALFGRLDPAQVIVGDRVIEVSRRKSQGIHLCGLVGELRRILPSFFLHGDQCQSKGGIHKSRVSRQRLRVFLDRRPKLSLLLMDIAQQRPGGGEVRVDLYGRAEFLLSIGEFIFAEGFESFFVGMLRAIRSTHCGRAYGGAGHVLRALDENNA